MHGSTGDIIFLGTTTPQLEEIFYELTHKHNQDLGGSGSNLRTPADCIGRPAANTPATTPRRCATT
jgi:sulfite reductase alpha subunit